MFETLYKNAICVLIIKATLVSNIKLFDELDARYYCNNARRLCAKSMEQAPHVVCKYHGQKRDCRHYKYHDICESMATEIVSRINKVRSAVANGNAEGEDGYLPTGYGMMRVSWDSELAAIAKLVISMCHSQTDYTCAATSKFRNPVMAYLSSTIVDPIEEALDDILTSFEEYRVTSDDIFVGPSVRDEDPKLRFLKVVVGDLTHIGCALAVHQSFQNDLSHLKCYLSHSPVQNMPVYNTGRPRLGDGTSPRCGCPKGYREDEDCLCVAEIANTTPSPLRTSRNYQPQKQSFNQIKPIQPKIRKRLPSNPIPTIQWPSIRSHSECNASCKPKIVMMPIFTLQNAPRPKRNDTKSAFWRRSDIDANLRSAVTVDDFYFSDEAAEPADLTVRSQLLHNLKKTREKEGVQFYSSEEKHLPTHELHWNKIMSLLDLLESKTKSTNLTSREAMEARIRLKEIRDKVLGRQEYVLPEVYE